MAEKLKELVERLDSKEAVWMVNRYYDWPRLRDSILAMREELERVKMVVGEVDYDIIEALLERLDHPEPATFGSKKITP